MASPKLVRSLAKTVAATAFGGPLAGAGAAVDAAIDLVVGQLDQQDKDVYSAAIRRLEGGAKAFARSEGLSEAAADRSLTEAQLLIARHGPSVGDMVAADLDPGRVSELVLRRGARELRLLGEGDEELCRRVVRSVYDALLLDPAGLPGVEAAFRRAVLATLRTLPADVADAVRVAVRDIVANLPATESPAAGLPPADLRELYQGVFERHALFAGRERELAILDGAVAMVRDQDAGRYVCVSGAAGLGKSALLVNWVRRLDADDRVAYVFINRLAGTAEELPTLQALCQQLLPPAERAVPLPADATDLRARVRRLLATSPEHRPSIVVIDGLDEADWMPSALVPLVPPPGRAIVLSRRATSDAWVRELGLARDSVTPITLETLGVDEVARLLKAAGGAAAQLAKDRVFVEKLHRVAVYEAGGERPGGDPLYVRLLVDDVRERRILSADDLDRHSDGLYAYFDGWWEEITGALSGAVLRDLLGYLLVAKGPIARAELVAISADDALDEFGGENVLPFATVRARARRFVLGDDSGLALAHPRFEAYLRSTRFDSTLTDDYAARLRAYCARWADVQRLGPYALSHYAAHLHDAGATEELHDLLTDVRFIDAKLRTLGIDALLADYELVREPAASAPATVGQALRRSRMALAREPDQLAAQLHGRLIADDDDRLRGLVAQLGTVAPEPWLAARSAAMASAQDLNATLTLTGTVRALAFGALEQSTILAVGVDDRISLHDPLKGASELRTLQNDGWRVTALCLGTLAGRLVVVAASGYDGRLIVRDAASGEPVGPIVSLPSYVDSVALGLLGGTPAIMAAGNGAAWAWDAHSREAVDIATDGLPGWITGVTTLDGRAILMVLGRRKGGTPELLLVDAASGDAVKPGVFRGIASDPKAFVAAEVGGGVVLAILWAEGLCGLWSAETGHPTGPYVDLGDAPVRCIAAADVSGRALLAASLDYAGTGIVLLREAGRRDRTARIAPTTPEDRPIHALRADETGQIIALTGLAPRLQTAHHDGDDLLTTVDYTPTDEMVALMLTGATAPAGFTQASPSGSTALIDESAFGARGTAHAERLRRSAPIEWPATARCWAALGGRAVLAVGSYAGVVWVWDIRDGSLISGPFADIPEEIYVAGPQLKAQRPPHVTSVAIGRCGGRDVVTTACGGAVQLWDADSGERLPGPDVGNEFIDALALGRIRGRDALVTGSRGGVLRLWDATEARRIAAVTLDAGVDAVWAVRGANTIAALTADFHLHFFDVRSRAVR